MAFKTGFEFVLPLGYIDKEGTVHRRGVMRLATAKDEILPLQDARVSRNRSYLIVLLLSRVITQLEGVSSITPQIIEDLFAEDLRYLQTLYQQINRTGTPNLDVACPHCKGPFQVDLGAVSAGEL
ncbi:MAG: phage tail assembly protein [Myxococcota bacterium]